MITKQDFLSFLIDLQQSVKDETISEKDQQDLTLLYIKHKYKDVKEEKIDYFSLGWYIHEILLKKQSNTII